MLHNIIYKILVSRFALLITSETAWLIIVKFCVLYFIVTITFDIAVRASKHITKKPVKITILFKYMPSCQLHFLLKILNLFNQFVQNLPFHELDSNSTSISSRPLKRKQLSLSNNSFLKICTSSELYIIIVYIPYFSLHHVITPYYQIVVIPPPY